MTTKIAFTSQSRWRRVILTAVLSLLVCRLLVAQQPREVPLKIGSKIPALSGVDQFGRQQNFNSLKGQNGLVLLFFRSADW